MRLLFFLFFMFSFNQVFAFDKCDDEINYDELKNKFQYSTEYRVPLKYMDRAERIIFSAGDNASRFHPSAIRKNNLEIIHLPLIFPKVLCKIVLGSFVWINNDFDNKLTILAKKSAKCFNSGRSESVCLSNFGDNLKNEYYEKFKGLSNGAQDTAYNVYRHALNQIIMHEYSHHFLNHFARIKENRVSRLNAEFEADLFSILNGIHSGELVHAMFYFFQPLAEIEKYTKTLTTKTYESNTCRSLNISTLGVILGVAPLLLFDAASGGRKTVKRNSPKKMRLEDEKFKKAVQFKRDSTSKCNKLDIKLINTIHAEFREVNNRVVEDVGQLFDINNMPFQDFQHLISDLAKMTKDFLHLNTLSAAIAASILRQRGIVGNDLSLLEIDSIDTLLNQSKVKENIFVSDLGRLFLAKGLFILQVGTGLSTKSRLEKSLKNLKKSVLYNPNLYEAWVNLKFIAIKRGDCMSALKYNYMELETINTDEKEELKYIALSIERLKKLSTDKEACKESAAGFHPYNGL